MGQEIANGSQLAIATALSVALGVTAASNAAACILTTASAHSYSVGDFVEYISGWPDATNRVFRLSAASGSSLTLEGFDTTSTSRFPVGGGIGSVRKINTWTPILQILSPTFDGGDPESIDVQYLESKRKLKVTTGFSSIGLSWQFGDDISLPGYQAYRAAALSRAQTPLRITSPSGKLSLYTGTCNLNENPTLELDDIIKVNASYDVLGDVVRY
jgi:hypothetical protein